MKMRIFHSKLTFMHYVAIFLCVICLYRFIHIWQLERNFDNNKELDPEENVEDQAKLDDNYMRVAELREDYMNTTKYPLFQPTEEVEFPTIENGSPRIPPIIHQIWGNESIPDNFVYSMQSFVEQNPTWKYMFWTYDSGRKFLLDRHPYLINVYDKFGESVKRSDLLRYAVLYEFGGIYSDLDVINIRPLDIATIKYACILPLEPLEHSTILNDMLILVNTAVLLCKPKHPFFKQLLLNLQLLVYEDAPGFAVSQTGPGFITRVYMKYNELEMLDLSRPKTDNNTNSPFFYKGTRLEEDEDGLYIPNSQYFIDTIDPSLIDNDGNLMDCVDGTPLTYLGKRGCAEFEYRREVRKRRKYAFTAHYWIHMWLDGDAEMRALRYLHIKEIIPNCILYGDNT